MSQLDSTYRGTLLAAAIVASATTAASAQQTVQIDTEWTFNAGAAHPGDTVRAVLEVTVQDTFHVNSNQPLEDFLIPTMLAVTPPEGFAVSRIVYPEALQLEVGFSEVPMAVFENEFAIGVELEVGDDVAPGSYTIKGELSYQACNDQYCLAPDSLAIEEVLEVVAPDVTVTIDDNWPGADIDFSAGTAPVETTPPTDGAVTTGPDCDVMAELEGFTLLGTAGGDMSEEEFLEFINAAESGVQQKSMFADKGLLTIIFLIIVGGVLLNLTPCVLPLIPINLAIIGAGAQSGSRFRGFALGGTYGLAMALAYGVLGLVVVLAAGEFAFGTINSTIWFNVAIAILFVVLALAMFDIIAIDFTKYQGKLDVTSKMKQGTFALAFAMGIVTAVLAGACVAPVVIQVIVYSSDLYTKGQTIGLILPFLLGVGLALPWPFAGAGIGCLPKPGMWMVRVKQALGLFILIFAGYYGYLAWGIWDNTHGGTEYAADLEGGWTDSICDGLATAKAESKFVLVDMWATWCKNCKAMDEGTLKEEAVVARLENYVKIKYQAEKLNVSPAEEMLRLFNNSPGLPTYAILKPTGTTPTGQ